MTSKNFRQIQPAHTSDKFTVREAREVWLKVEGKTIPNSSRAASTGRSATLGRSNDVVAAKKTAGAAGGATAKKTAGAAGGATAKKTVGSAGGAKARKSSGKA